MSSENHADDCQEQSEDRTNRSTDTDAVAAGTADSRLDFEFISQEKVEPLNHRQKQIYCQKRTRFIEYLREKGKVQYKEVGYAEGSVKPMARLIQQVFEYVWENQGHTTTDLTQDQADDFIDALSADEIRRNDGDRYDGDSKRKFNDVLRCWFEWNNEDWEPAVTFESDGPRDNSDPFTKGEMERLWQASLDYKSIPTYNNVGPEERDRWKAHIAQELGIPKEDVTPEHWTERNTSWKIPALIRTTRETGWRCAMVARLKIQWYKPETQVIVIPREDAVKNDVQWRQKLSDEAADTLERWLDQRKNKTKYDGRDEIWLNRESNPYSSENLNRLLNDLIDEAGINPNGRKLTWHSFRHYVATYTYQEYRDLKMVAEVLRQKTKSAAERYVHVPEEMKEQAASHL
ncbi:tyrosine-type recombinase/integrase [Halorientalis marina]|uniref:tyrosine-type recombinase/integrase n=1 Tax=Halorientalis marina TaxID=2931976 RepID=UPI001FF6EDF6|nr:site-specific integrase [Halorientalis marina]